MALATMTILFITRTRNVENTKRYRYFVAALLGLSTVNYCLSQVSYFYEQRYGETRLVEPAPWWTLVVIPEIMAILVTLLCDGLLVST
jgi:hypothetical protein